MKCPNDDTTLVMSERQGIEIDYCPTCRGVWLDRGELDKIIERSQEQSKPARSYEPRLAADQPHPASQHKHYQEEARGEYPQQQHSQYHRKKKRESFLGDLFDF